MFQTSQWVQVRPGASGSSTIKARLLTVLGRFSMRRGGFTFEASHVYFFGIFPPSENVLLVTLRAAAGAAAFSVCAKLLTTSASATNKNNPVIAFMKCIVISESCLFNPQDACSSGGKLLSPNSRTQILCLSRVPYDTRDRIAKTNG